jgi:hypothetical protein
MRLFQLLDPHLGSDAEALVLGSVEVASVAALLARGVEVVVVDHDVSRFAELPDAVVVDDDPATLPIEPETSSLIVAVGVAAFEAATRIRVGVRPGGLAVVLLPSEGGVTLGVPPRSWFAGWEILHDARSDDGGAEVIARRPAWDYELRRAATPLAEPEPIGPGGLRWEELRAPATPEFYVKRPWGGGDALARLLAQGLSPIAVFAPTGTGKTTELLRAAEVLARSSLVFHVDLPSIGAADLPAPVLVWELTRTLVEQWVERDLAVLPTRLLIKDLRASNPRLPAGDGKVRRPIEMLHAALAELHGVAPRVVVMLDGLDTVPVGPAREHAEALLGIKRSCVLVVAVGPELVSGPDSQVVLDGYRLFAVPTPPMALAHDDAVAFLVAIVERRLGALPPVVAAVVRRAAERSGGAIGRFLDLVVGAAGYASALDGLNEGLDDALRDAAEGMRRLLVHGDAAALRDVAGSAGLEMDLERRTRLLRQGLLLEYAHGEDVVLTPSPLLARSLGR